MATIPSPPSGNTSVLFIPAGSSSSSASYSNNPKLDLVSFQGLLISGFQSMALSCMTGSWTIEFFMCFPAYTSWAGLFAALQANIGDATNILGLAFNQNNKINSVIYKGSGNSGGSLSSKTWYHVALVYSATGSQANGYYYQTYITPFSGTTAGSTTVIQIENLSSVNYAASSSIYLDSLLFGPQWPNNSTGTNCLFSILRISKTARYLSNTSMAIPTTYTYDADTLYINTFSSSSSSSSSTGWNSGESIYGC